MEPFAQFISTLMQSRNQAHIYHLQTDSFAAHKALNEYYDSIIPLVDSLVESYQGRYGILRGYEMTMSLKEYDNMNSVVTYFMGLQVFVDSIRTKIPQDSFLQNQVDEVIALISSTNYKLKFLS